MDQNEIYDKIQKWEREAQESFFDYFGSEVNPVSFMYWCVGKGYVDQNKFSLWEDAFSKGKLEAEDLNYYIVSDDCEFAVVIMDETYDEEVFLEKGLHIFAEFVSVSATYQYRLEQFLKGNGKNRDKI